jgi:DNA-binding SARP family transcriptional activator
MMKRRAMQERVYLLDRRGRSSAAIGELAGWTKRYPRDREALLWLARLLREEGRTREALATYRQLLSIGEGTR